MKMVTKTPKLRIILRQRLEDLKRDRKTWDEDVREIGEHMAPYRVHDEGSAKELRNDGRRRDAEIINPRPLRARATLNAGMQSGLTSPARPWFGLTVSNKELRKVPAVRMYLDQVKEIMLEILQLSNWYDVLANSVYPDLSSIGTASLDMRDDDRGGVTFVPHRWGEYWVDRSIEGEPEVHFWRRPWTVRQIVEEFGYDNCSPMVRKNWDEHRFNVAFTVIRAVYHNRELRAGAIGVDGMPWASMWWEETNPNMDKWLRKSGFREFPTLVPGWSIDPGDNYGRGPGWEILGACKALQHHELAKATIIDLMKEPPTVLKGAFESVNLLPGGTTRLELGEDADVRPLHLVDPRAIGEVRQEIAELERQIDAGMYSNLWLAALRDSEAGGQRPTATEVQARKTEVFLMLGPLLQNLERDLLHPMIARLYAILERNNRLPDPPEELAGTEFSVEFISILHTAQRTAAAAGLQAFVEEVLKTSQIDPQVLDKVDVDAVADQFATMYGVSPEVIRSSKEVEQLRAARAQAQRAKEEGEAAVMAARGMRDLSGADPERLAQMVGAASPIAAAQSEVLQ